MAHVVLDEGPIQYANLERYHDSDVETGLERSGHNAGTTTFRLIEIDLADVEDHAGSQVPDPGGLRWWRNSAVESDCPRSSS